VERRPFRARYFFVPAADFLDVLFLLADDFPAADDDAGFFFPVFAPDFCVATSTPSFCM
jgi:hypothetical protein